MTVTDWMALTILLIILAAGVVIIVLAFLDRLPFPKPQDREPTELEKAGQELADNMYEMKLVVAEALRPTLEKINRAVTRISRR